jgi:hypothetical protein
MMKISMDFVAARAWRGRHDEMYVAVLWRLKYILRLTPTMRRRGWEEVMAFVMWRTWKL